MNGFNGGRDERMFLYKGRWYLYSQMGQAYHARVSQGFFDKILDTQPDRQMEVQVARFDAWVRMMGGRGWSV